MVCALYKCFQKGCQGQEANENQRECLIKGDLEKAHSVLEVSYLNCTIDSLRKYTLLRLPLPPPSLSVYFMYVSVYLCVSLHACESQRSTSCVHHTRMPPCPDFLYGFWEGNSGLHVCAASTLPITLYL